ncbi:MAG: TonB system transport protein ExbD [Granulosicoccaceae bacterium]|jgi:biopolymer transport protein ExbD
MKPLAAINVIPFIDIMLVLLAIVLTTSTFLAQGKIPLRLPQAKQAVSIPPAKSLTISIDDSGQFYLDDEAIQPGALTRRLDKANVDTPILLRVDRQTEFAHFIVVIDLLKAKSLNNLAIVTNRAGR